MRLRPTTAPFHRGAASLLAICLVSTAAGCGGASNGKEMGPGGDDGGVAEDDLAGPDPDLGSPYPAPFPPAPQVTNAQGGAVLTDPVFVPVFFSNFDATKKAALKSFITQVGASDYWKQTTSEYGVGPATTMPAVELKEMASGTIDQAGIASWLANKVISHDPNFWPVTDQMVFVLHYPAAMTITMQKGMVTQTSCNQFGGYHSETMGVVFAVIPDCDMFDMLTGIDEVTGTESHELIEACTDPHAMSGPAFNAPDTDHLFWAFALGGGEVGDMCAQDPLAFAKFPGLDYKVQRSWSNQAALSGHEPCVPSLPGEVYFAAAPELHDMIALGGGVTAMGAQIPVGQSKTITLDLFSDADTGAPWTVKAHDAAFVYTPGPASLQIALDKTTGRNGDKIQMTIKSVAAAQNGIGTFYVESKLGARTHVWFGLVGQN